MTSCNHRRATMSARVQPGEEDRWVVAASREADQCENPVRSCEELYFQEPMANRDTSKSLIKLSIGVSFNSQSSRDTPTPF